jgi:peroxiredoxin Q/BCP
MPSAPANPSSLTESTTPPQARILASQNATLKASKGRHMAAKAKPAKQPASKKPAKKLAPDKASSSKLGPGGNAPNFSLPRDGGTSVSLADFTGQNLVLYFYPRADTPGCTKEAIDFSRLRGAFAKANTQIVGVSADPVPAQDKFKAKHKLSIALASDETHRMIDDYGVWQEKSLYGRKFMGIVRTTFLIGPDQRIAKVWPKVSVDGHAEAVLAAAKEL